MAYNIDEETAKEMYQDFYDLKKSGLPATTTGNLGIHPILKRESMNGPFSDRFRLLVLKYALPSRYERIAIMGTGSAGTPWEFAASQPIKNGVVTQSPIPCQKPGELSNMLKAGIISGLTQSPSMTGCDEFNLEAVTYFPERGGRPQQFGNNPASIAAVKTVNPEQTFFASTTCGNCHMAVRGGASPAYVEATKTFAKHVAYQLPTDVTQGFPTSEPGTRWAVRAFGYGEAGREPEVNHFTINDTMRVAHELNDLIREGKIK